MAELRKAFLPTWSHAHSPLKNLTCCGFCLSQVAFSKFSLLVSVNEILSPKCMALGTFFFIFSIEEIIPNIISVIWLFILNKIKNSDPTVYENCLSKTFVVEDVSQ